MSKKKTRFVLGLTGSIAMGKTTVSNMFRDLGVPVWCADNAVKKLYQKNGAATRMMSKEYPDVVTENGVDKNKLRNLIHVDNRILKNIEAIVHPLLQNSKNNFLKTNKHQSLVIYDIPLLFEKDLEKDFDAVLVVTASAITQRNRVLGRKNITDKDFQLIKRNQLGEKEKIKKADFVINTDRSLTETRQDVLQIYEKITELV